MEIYTNKLKKSIVLDKLNNTYFHIRCSKVLHFIVNVKKLITKGHLVGDESMHVIFEE